MLQVNKEHDHEMCIQNMHRSHYFQRANGTVATMKNPRYNYRRARQLTCQSRYAGCQKASASVSEVRWGVLQLKLGDSRSESLDGLDVSIVLALEFQLDFIYIVLLSCVRSGSSRVLVELMFLVWSSFLFVPREVFSSVFSLSSIFLGFSRSSRNRELGGGATRRKDARFSESKRVRLFVW